MKASVPIIVQAVSSHSYWVKSIFSGLRESAEKGDYVLDFIGDAARVNRADYPESGSIIVIGYAADWLKNTLDDLIKKGFQPIVVNAWLSPVMLKYCNGVSFRLKESVEHAVQYLASAGRHKVALLGTNAHSLADSLKEETFKQVIGEYYGESELYIFPGGNPLCECIDEFIESFVENDIDAVLCANDTVAIHLINRMMKDGFNIPENLYVIGMGNSRLGQRISIPLSSVDFDYEELGRQALGLWRYIQRGNNKVHAEISIPCRFIARASTDDVAQSEAKFTSVGTDFMPDSEMETNVDEFYEDADVQKIIKFEVFLRACDDMDYRVLEEILQGRSDSKMAERLNISDRAIRYRINKMTKKLGVQTREEIVNIVRDLRAFE